MDIDAMRTSRNSNCFNCRKEGHFSKDCGQTKIQCLECHFFGGGHQKGCKKHKGKGKGHQVQAMDSDAATSWDKDKSTDKKQETKDKGKAHDWASSIRGMNLEEACAWFKD